MVHEISIGEKFSKLTVLERVENVSGGGKQYLCLCECGNEKKVGKSGLISGKTKSCGCHRRTRFIEMNKSHGLSRHPLYDVWCNMKDRCDNSKNISYKDYGGRGIGYCDRWRDFALFFSDVCTGYKQGLQLDRFPNNNGNYEPDNFRWATPSQQMRNVRNNVWIEYGGNKMIASDWARVFKIRPSTLYNYLKNHSFSEAICKYA